jgi:hypothetical protein
MGIRGDEGDACRVVDISPTSTIPHHLPISFSYIYIKMKSCQENKILTDSSTKCDLRDAARTPLPVG